MSIVDFMGSPWMREAADKLGIGLHVGCRLPLGDGEVYVLPLDAAGYAGMNKALTEKAHGRTWEWPGNCVLLADRWGVALMLREQSPDPDRGRDPHRQRRVAGRAAGPG